MSSETRCWYLGRWQIVSEIRYFFRPSPHSIGDARMAIREAEAKGIHTHALAVDAVAKDYLPEMLGQGACNVLHRPEQLPEL